MCVCRCVQPTSELLAKAESGKSEGSGVWGLRSGSEGPGVWETGIGETEGWEQLPERPTVVGSLSC